MKPIALALFLLSLGVLVFSSSASAASVNKNKADRITAKKVLANYGQARSAVARIKISSALVDEVFAEAVCTQNMLEAIDTSPLSEEERFAWAFSVFAIYVYDLYFTVASSAKSGLKKQANILKRKTDRLMKRSKTRAAKEITRSLKAQGAFATVFARNIDVSMCAIEERLTDLGGYTNENLETALTEEIELSGLGDFVEGPAGESVDRISGQLNKGVSQMQRIRPRLNKKQIERYNDGLVDAILRKISAAGRMKGAFRDGVLSPRDGSLLKGRDRILR